MAIYSVIIIVAISGICQLKNNDDIRALQTVPESLAKEEKQIKEIIGSDLGMDFFVVQGDSSNQVLEHEYFLTKVLDETFPEIQNKYMAISSYVPSIKAQMENFKLVKQHLLNDNLAKHLQKIGIKKSRAIEIQQNLTKIPFMPMTIDDWLLSSASKPMRFLWLGKIDDKFISIVLLSQKLIQGKLEAVGKKFGFLTYVNKAHDVSQVFKKYRERTLLTLLIIYGIIFILLISRYAVKKSFFYFIPTISANALSLGIMGWLNVPLTLFNVLALFLILGIAMDYVLFFAETKVGYRSTMLATSLSAIATLLSFGLLVFSNIPVLHYFGLTVLVGIGSAFLLTPLVVLKNEKIF